MHDIYIEWVKQPQNPTEPHFGQLDPAANLLPEQLHLQRSRTVTLPWHSQSRPRITQRVYVFACSFSRRLRMYSR
jgi:hypothetical protein